MKLYEYHPIPGSTSYTKPSLPPLFGTEYEIEGVVDYSSTQIVNNFKIVSDGSLRNNGKEFITPPVTFDESLELFKILHDHLELSDNSFSERTSIHVHVNCANLEVRAILNFIRFYIITEPIWMAFVGKKRENSIFCVPLYSTYLQGNYNRGLRNLENSWHKYTAFNICPLTRLGTIEFRHLYGTNDYKIYYQWLSSINNLIAWAKGTENLNFINFFNEESQLFELIKTLLSPIIKQSDQELKEMCAPTLLDLKLSFID